MQTQARDNKQKTFRIALVYVYHDRTPELTPLQSNHAYIKVTFSVHKLIPRNTQMTTLYTNLSLYITFTMIYYIRQE